MAMDQKTLKSLLRYEPSTGTFRWLADRPPRCKAGGVAGYNNGSGYNKISLGGRRYYAHRLAFLYMTGEMPPGVIDHINGDGIDNRWENLRCVSQKENGANKTTGVGVRFKDGSWHARYAGKHLGVFDSKEEATNAYRSAKVSAAMVDPYSRSPSAPNLATKKWGWTRRVYAGKSLNKWAKELGISQQTLYYQVVKLKKPLEEVVRDMTK